MFPFHTWLPAAHVEAPTAGSVLLASILLKMGTYGFLRFCLPITPDATMFFVPYILWLSVVAILYGGLHRPGPERPEETGRLFQRRAHGLCHAGHLRPEPAGA